MSINEIYPMRKRRSINKTPGKTPTRSSTNCNEGRVIQQTPKRITSNSSFSECEIVWDNHSPSPSRTLLRKRKKKTVSDESSSDNNDIADLVKKLADKTGQTPQDSSLYNFWFNEQEPQAENQSTNNNKTTSSSKKKHLQTPARRPRVLRKSRKSKNRLTKELEMLASMMKNTENNGKTNQLPNPEVNSSSRKHFEASSPLSSRQGNAVKPTQFETRSKPEMSTSCTEYRDAKKPKTTTTHSSPCLSDIGDIDWEDDDDVDVMLSQVDISALCQQDNQVFTHTQHPDMEQLVTPQEQRKGSNDTSFLTESWDFEDDDSDELIQTLEQVERTVSQSLVKVPDSIKQKEQSTNHCPSKYQSKTKTSKCVYSKQDIERKKLEAQQRRKQSRLKTACNKPNTRRNASRLKR